MKKLTSLIIFVGLAFNVSGQEDPKNLKEAMDAAKARWLIGDWELENADGEHSQKRYKWGIEDSVILVHSKTNREYHGVVGFDAGKVVGKYFGNNVVADTEWSGDGNGKLVEIVKMRGLNSIGEVMEFNYGRVINQVDENTFEMLIHQLSATGELGEVMKNQDTGAPFRVQTWKRKK
jgi:hypothetical protein